MFMCLCYYVYFIVGMIFFDSSGGNAMLPVGWSTDISLADIGPNINHLLVVTVKTYQILPNKGITFGEMSVGQVIDFSINRPSTENRLRSQRTTTPYTSKVNTVTINLWIW